MKAIVFLIVCILSLHTAAQEAKPKFDGKKWVAPYMLDTPEGWDIERFLIPIQFAPSIPYKGVEDIRFTPRWSKKESPEYWSYDFLWYLNGEPTFNTKTIEKNLTAYYTGLASVNIDTTKVDANKLVTVKAILKDKKLKSPGQQAFEGTVTILDFMTLKPLTLNIRIYISRCKEQFKTVVFHEVSPMPYKDVVWKSLDGLRTNFQCITR